jgi:hypothetical protein
MLADAESAGSGSNRVTALSNSNGIQQCNLMRHPDATTKQGEEDVMKMISSFMSH